MKKCCTKCKQIKDINEFHRNSERIDGHSSRCRSCANAYTKKHYYNNRQYYFKRNKQTHLEKQKKLIELKSKTACNRCGFCHPAAIDFHHPDPKLKNKKGMRISNSFNVILNEINKCIPLCSNCHRILHYEQRKNGRGCEC